MGYVAKCKVNNAIENEQTRYHISDMQEIENIKKIGEFDDKSLLIVDDDNPFRERLARAMERRAFQYLKQKV